TAWQGRMPSEVRAGPRLASLVLDGSGRPRSHGEDVQLFGGVDMNLRIACQTYTWEMLGGDWNGTLADILSEISQAGYEGIEISTNVLGGLVDRPREVRSMLESHGLELAAVAFSRPSGFTREEAASD